MSLLFQYYSLSANFIVFVDIGPEVAQFQRNEPVPYLGQCYTRRTARFPGEESGKSE